MDVPPVTLFICVTPSYCRWLEYPHDKCNAISSCRAQTYPDHELAILTFDDGTPVWEMFQKCLEICRTPYYGIIGADDWIGPEYVSLCARALLIDPSKVAVATTKMWLVDKNDEKIGYDDHFNGSGIWNTDIARNLGGYEKPEGRKWGCVSDLIIRANRAGFKTALLPFREYYYRIWQGSVSKTSKDLDRIIAERDKDEPLMLGGAHDGNR
jgi:hypothetical protein